jgi:hypothetical protein
MWVYGMFIYSFIVPAVIWGAIKLIDETVEWFKALHLPPIMHYSIAILTFLAIGTCLKKWHRNYLEKKRKLETELEELDEFRRLKLFYNNSPDKFSP